MVTAEIIKWFAVLLAFEAAGFPFCFKFLKNLPEKGVAFSRTIGLVIFGYFFWLFCSLGFIQNNIGGILTILFPFGFTSIYLYLKQKEEINQWVTRNIRIIAWSEIVFLIGFILMIIFRLSDPNILGTEKPMEMTFINGILKSDTFPPHDSWLSGYAISYYYFGYVLTALLIKISNVLPTSGFNLMLATIFALAAEGSFGIVNDILESYHEQKSSNSIHFSSFLAPFFVLLSGNMEGIFEVLYSKHFFWNQNGTSGFWKWLDLKELCDTPTTPVSWNPTIRQGIWWWRASRVIQDYSLDGNSHEVIDEFPFFSFYLGDLHPHVLAIPFVIMTLALSLNVLIFLLSQNREYLFLSECITDENLSIKDSNIYRWILSSDFWFTAICLGSLIFMNTWDFPFYFAIFVICIFIGAYKKWGFSQKSIAVFFEAAFTMGLACIFLYFLFLHGLSTQAGGLVPSGIFSTRLPHLLLMFGLFLPIIIFWAIKVFSICKVNARKNGVKFGIFFFLILFLIEFILTSLLILCSRSNNSKGIFSLFQIAAKSFSSTQGFDATASPLSSFLKNRLNTLPTMILLFGIISLVWGILSNIHSSHAFETNDEISQNSSRIPQIFVGILLLLSLALIIFPEFFYLRDFFGTRMNTIFKFYYQAWNLMAISAAACCGLLFKELKKNLKIFFSIILTICIFCSAIYTFWGITTKDDGLILQINNHQKITLDGSTFLQNSNPDEWKGIEWLSKADPGIIVEKVGNSYTTDNSISTFSGQPTISGPANHESQWRGGYKEIGSRSDDVKSIYESRDWKKVKSIMDNYHVRYIFIGSTERNAYTIQEQKFEKYLTKVFESNDCRIYQVY